MTQGRRRYRRRPCGRLGLLSRVAASSHPPAASPPTGRPAVRPDGSRRNCGPRRAPRTPHPRLSDATISLPHPRDAPHRGPRLSPPQSSPRLVSHTHVAHASPAAHGRPRPPAGARRSAWNPPLTAVQSGSADVRGSLKKIAIHTAPSPVRLHPRIPPHDRLQHRVTPARQFRERVTPPRDRSPPAPRRTPPPHAGRRDGPRRRCPPAGRGR
jgi:hypothetical protein